MSTSVRQMLVAIGVGIALALTLSGCVSMQDPPQPANTAGLGTKPPADSRVVGSGSFNSAESSIAGRVVLYARDKNVFLDAAGVTAKDSGRFELSLSPFASDTQCLADKDNQVLGWVRGKGPRWVGIGSYQTDPSFYQSIVISRSEAVHGSPCRLEVVAAAPLSWHMPDTHPSLRVLDSGPVPGASGKVELAAGAPAAYDVAQGDTLFDIANRFGVSPDDLSYLNPLAQTPITPGERLNLLKSQRGVRENG